MLNNNQADLVLDIFLKVFYFSSSSLSVTQLSSISKFSFTFLLTGLLRFLPRRAAPATIYHTQYEPGPVLRPPPWGQDTQDQAVGGRPPANKAIDRTNPAADGQAWNRHPTRTLRTPGVPLTSGRLRFCSKCSRYRSESAVRMLLPPSPSLDLSVISQ